ncbi:MAG: pyridoxal phosphate-dependent aminotransferase [Synergistaceae bacterium]|jgi:aspartate aminotransferase/aminotransferase|nr:pyridoxal phosphate-dependent aminotransferase [Synergistaceae bacterium]
MDRIKLPNKRYGTLPEAGGIYEIAALADMLEENGKKIYHLEIGRPDFDSPQIAKDAAKEALDRGFVHYPDTRGILQLRQALSRKLKRENRMEVSPDDVLITIGAQTGIMAIMLTILDEGDEVIIPTPCFGPYAEDCRLLGGVVVPAPCAMEDGFTLKASNIEPLVTGRTKIIVVNSPNNPTGAVIPRFELEKIAEIAKKHDLLVVSDECYERFIYAGEHASIASLPGMDDRTITVGTASKTYSMTGWRLGYMSLPSWLTNHVGRTHRGLAICAASFAQYGYASALDNAEEDVIKMLNEYRERRNIVTGYLERMEDIDFATPDGAFYIFPSIKRTGISSPEFCRYILEEAGVAIVPGEAFEAPGFVRIAYCQPKEHLTEAMELMRSALSKLKVKNRVLLPEKYESEEKNVLRSKAARGSNYQGHDEKVRHRNENN